MEQGKSTAFSRIKEFPTGFWFVFWGELAERASYYGMRTVLALFLLDVMHFDRGRSGQTVQFFIGICYLLTIVGGVIADRFLGKFKTIVYFSIPYILGHFILGNARDPVVLYLALGLLAIGAGSVKPNVSPLMGEIFDKKGLSHHLTEAFSYYYAAINMGAFVTSWFLPKIRDSYGYTLALIFPAIAMTISMVLFVMGKKYYPVEDVRKLPPKTVEQKKEERQTLLRISGIFALIVAFWFVYDQSASTWIFFARDHMNLELWPFGIKLAADQVQAFNSLFIVILTPFFVWFWNFLGRKRGKPVTSIQKMMAGFILTFICMAAMAFAGLLAQSGPVSVWWEVIATFVITLSELCVSVVGLEFAYSVASPRTKSTVTGAFFLTFFGGDFIGGLFAGYYEKYSPAVFFGAQALILALVTIAFYFEGKKFEKRTGI